MKYSVFIDPPEGFNPAVECAGCYCEWEDKILLLKRHPEKSQGNTWGVPGGKMEINEDPRMAVIREIREEVGLNIDDNGLACLGKIYCRLPHVDYVYHVFRKRFHVFPIIDLALEEHLELKWVTLNEALTLPLIAGGAEAINYYKKRCV